MDISSWLTELFINHFYKVSEYSVAVYIFYSISAHYSFIAIEFKLEMNFFTMYLATSPLPIQLFHWFLFFHVSVSFTQMSFWILNSILTRVSDRQRGIEREGSMGKQSQIE